MTPQEFRQAWNEMTEGERDLIRARCAGVPQVQFAAQAKISIHGVNKRMQSVARTIRSFAPTPASTTHLMESICYAYGYNKALDDLDRTLAARRR